MLILIKTVQNVLNMYPCYLNNTNAVPITGLDCVCMSMFLYVCMQLNKTHFFRVPTDLRNAVYCVGIRTGGQDAWEFLWERYKKSNVGNEQNVILSSLGCSREVWILNRFIVLMIF